MAAPEVKRIASRKYYFDPITKQEYATPPERPGGFFKSAEYPRISQYQEDKYSDGSIVVSLWDADKKDWVTVDERVDEDIRKLYLAEKKAEESSDIARERLDKPQLIGSVTKHDKYIRFLVPDGKGGWTIKQEDNPDYVGSAPPDFHKLPSGGLGTWDESTKKLEEVVPAPPPLIKPTVVLPDGSVVNKEELELRQKVEEAARRDAKDKEDRLLDRAKAHILKDKWTTEHVQQWYLQERQKIVDWLTVRTSDVELAKAVALRSTEQAEKSRPLSPKQQANRQKLVARMRGQDAGAYEVEDDIPAFDWQDTFKRNFMDMYGTMQGDPGLKMPQAPQMWAGPGQMTPGAQAGMTAAGAAYDRMVPPMPPSQVPQQPPQQPPQQLPQQPSSTPLPPALSTPLPSGGQFTSIPENTPSGPPRFGPPPGMTMEEWWYLQQQGITG